MDVGMIGPALVLSLGCIGSAIGCGLAGMTSHAVMSRVEENHGPFIAMSAVPSSQSIYGFILMYQMRDKILSGDLNPTVALGIAVAAGTALLVSSLYQGMCAASGMQAAAKEPVIISKCFAALGIVESFSLFVFVFTLLLV